MTHVKPPFFISIYYFFFGLTHFFERSQTKGSFTSTNALYKQVYCAIKKVEQKWTTALPNWALTMSQLDIFFPGRLKIELN
ncbi:MAG: hypothetical protein TV41_01920 [Wolbachia endosymbiont of Dactylopius coccus]|nr:MAG: hypothetical protein TV41_01920 [Wolbachia endosymbiont of Dactylopius coccus]